MTEPALPPIRFVRCLHCGDGYLDEIGRCPGCWSEGARDLRDDELGGTITSFTRVVPREQPRYWLVALRLDIGTSFMAPVPGDAAPGIGHRVSLGPPPPELSGICALAAWSADAAPPHD